MTLPLHAVVGNAAKPNKRPALFFDGTWNKPENNSYGFSENVRAGYRWLMEHYNRGDEIFIFGFSRGAFSRH